MKEGDSAELTCRATGNPQPKIRWSREDGKSIAKGQKSKWLSIYIGINKPQKAPQANMFANILLHKDKHYQD